MGEKIGTIRNPLTMIAFFSSVAEGIGPLTLPHIQNSNQSMYIWFLMIFPLTVVILFFITLNFNHKVLYSPSDFKNEDNFLKFFQPASSSDTIEKLQKEVRESEDKPISEPEQGLGLLQSDNEKMSHPRQTHSAILSRYFLVENLVLNKISGELGQPIKKDILINNLNTKFIFDGIVISDNKVIAIEVKYFPKPNLITNRFKDTFLKILYVAEGLPDSIRSQFSLIIAIVTDKQISDQDQIKEQLFQSVGITPFSVNIRFFSFDELQKEFNIVG